MLEIFSWLIEVENITKESRDTGKIKWSVSYVQDMNKYQNYSGEMMSANGGPEGRRQRVIARFQIMKDDTQSILPISRDRELMNTAVLTGRQVYKAMKVFIVSHSGTVADVTMISSCHSEDESVLKVSETPMFGISAATEFNVSGAGVDVVQLGVRGRNGDAGIVECVDYHQVWLGYGSRQVHRLDARVSA